MRPFGITLLLLIDHLAANYLDLMIWVIYREFNALNNFQPSSAGIKILRLHPLFQSL